MFELGVVFQFKPKVSVHCTREANIEGEKTEIVAHFKAHCALCACVCWQRNVRAHTQYNFQCIKIYTNKISGINTGRIIVFEIVCVCARVCLCVILLCDG